MALILDGNSEHVAQACRKLVLFGKKDPICDCSRSNQMPYTEETTELNCVYTYAPISELPTYISTLENNVNDNSIEVYTVPLVLVVSFWSSVPFF